MFKITASRSGSSFEQSFSGYEEAKSKMNWLKENGFTNIILDYTNYNAHTLS